jgi:biopolymer transport protein TolQ
MATLFLAAPIAAQGGSGNFDLLQLLLGSSGVVRGVLFLLVCLSIISWYVIGYKALYLNRAQNESQRFLEAFWQAKRLDAVYGEAEQKRRSPIAHMFKAGYVELSKLQNAKAQGGSERPHGGGEVWHNEGDLENIERALRRAFTHETTVLESMVPFLATVGSAAPFIGLFGTVIGIIDAFHQIANQGSANLATVAPGIAEALGTTAVGLIAAVPAVMAYNWFARKIKVLTSDMEAFSADFLNIVKRNFLR